jgi:hypothetical protein
MTDYNKAQQGSKPQQQQKTPQPSGQPAPRRDEQRSSLRDSEVR